MRSNYSLVAAVVALLPLSTVSAREGGSSVSGGGDGGEISIGGGADISGRITLARMSGGSISGTSVVQTNTVHADSGVTTTASGTGAETVDSARVTFVDRHQVNTTSVGENALYGGDPAMQISRADSDYIGGTGDLLSVTEAYSMGGATVLHDNALNITGFIYDKPLVQTTGGSKTVFTYAVEASAGSLFELIFEGGSYASVSQHQLDPVTRVNHGIARAGATARVLDSDGNVVADNLSLSGACDLNVQASLYRTTTTSTTSSCGTPSRQFGVDNPYGLPLDYILANTPVGPVTQFGLTYFFANAGMYNVEMTFSSDVDVVSNDVPEPAMIGLFGLGAAGLGFARRRRRP